MQPQSIGFGSCEGGFRPEPPIDDFPLLVWVDGAVRLEDGKATVVEVLAKFAEVHSMGHTAAHFGTTTHHVIQAVRYAERLNG